MTSQALTTTRDRDHDATLMEQVLLGGNLSALTPMQRLSYYRTVCDSLGLNPLTKPFDYLTLNGKLVLYAKKDATDQLRKKHNVSIIRLERDKIEGVYTVTAYARTADGREDSSIGAVNIDGLRGEALANAVMKAETKAKRRVTLSICGLGMLDETEIDSIPNAAPVAVDTSTGEIVDAPPSKRSHAALDHAHDHDPDPDPASIPAQAVPFIEALRAAGAGHGINNPRDLQDLFVAYWPGWGWNALKNDAQRLAAWKYALHATAQPATATAA